MASRCRNQTSDRLKVLGKAKGQRLCLWPLVSGAKESRTPDLFVANERAHRRNAYKTNGFHTAARKCPRLCAHATAERPFPARPPAVRTRRASAGPARRSRGADRSRLARSRRTATTDPRPPRRSAALGTHRGREHDLNARPGLSSAGRLPGALATTPLARARPSKPSSAERITAAGFTSSGTTRASPSGA